MENKIKEGSIEKIIGIVIVVAVIVIAIIIKLSLNGGNGKLEKVYVATGGGKEDFIADTDVVKTIQKEYKLDIVYDSWSNGKTVSLPLVREAIGLGNTSVSENEWSVRNDSCSKYDALFTSDERFYNYYKLQPKADEAERYQVLDGSLTLNTPIVIYSWKDIADVFIKQNIVTKKVNRYFIFFTVSPLYFLFHHQ